MTCKFKPKPSNLKFCFFDIICQMSMMYVIIGCKFYNNKNYKSRWVIYIYNFCLHRKYKLILEL